MRSYLAPLGIVPVLLQVAAGSTLSRTTEAQEATILDAKTECTAYNFAPATALVSRHLHDAKRLHTAAGPRPRADFSMLQASVYPTIWATADLSARCVTSSRCDRSSRRS